LLRRHGAGHALFEKFKPEFEFGPIQPTIGGIGDGRVHPRSGDTSVVA